MRVCELFESDAKHRALAAGFDVNELVYHGTRAGEFSAFKMNYRKGEQLGFGIHVTPDKNFASLYANDPDVATNRRGKQPHVFVGYLRKGKVLNADAIVKEGSLEFALAKKLAGSNLFTSKDADGVPCAYMQNAIDATSGKRAESLIKAAGYDTIRYKSKIINRGTLPGTFATANQAVSYVVLNSANLRRITAAFDPSKSMSDDLMA